MTLDRLSVRLRLLRSALREHLAHDFRPLRPLIGAGLYAAGLGLNTIRKRGEAFRWWMRVHSGAFAPATDRRIEARLSSANAAEQRGRPSGLWDAYRQTVAASVAAFRSAGSSTTSLLGSRVLVIKQSQPGERGVLLVDYSYVFPLLVGLFDISAILKRYFIVLEPSWSGVCAPEVLLYTQFDTPVFVQTVEPRDAAVLGAIRANMHAVPIAANWWVDYREIASPAAVRDIDVIMVAAWSDIKRHWRFFRAIARLKRRGHRLRVALVGYRYDKTQDDVEEEARYFGVADQIELHERIPSGEVARLLGRSKLHVLWSRRECANRAIIEAMLADVPVLVRRGLTFGHPYAYINGQTGRFADEDDLESAILDSLERRHGYAPRQWVLSHMTPQHATAILEEHIRSAALRLGERWTDGLVVRTSTLDTQRYWTASDRDRFTADYDFLRRAVLPVST